MDIDVAGDVHFTRDIGGVMTSVRLQLWRYGWHVTIVPNGVLTPHR